MSEFEVFIKVESSKYGDGFMVNKYGDQYSLIAARESNNGNNYKRWAFPQTKDRVAAEKAIPMAVPLGNRTEAIANLKAALAVLEGAPATSKAAATAASVMGGKVVDQEDIPF